MNLVKRAMKGDADAFMELMEANSLSMYKVARAILQNPEDIKDAIQDTILTCFEKLDTLREPKYFKTWMIRILINECRQILNKNQYYCPMDKLPEQADEQRDYAYLEYQELMNSISERYRTILVLHYVEGFKVQEIAELLNLNQNTVKTRLSRGRELLKEEYWKSERFREGCGAYERG